MKKFNAVLATLLFLVMILTPVTYANEMVGVGKSRNMDIQYSTRSLEHIMSVSSSIKDMADGDIYITADIRTDGPVDYLRISVTLEKFDGKSWKSVKTFASDASYNTNTIAYTTAYSGTIGQIYRIRATHVIKENGIPEVEETITSSIQLK